MTTLRALECLVPLVDVGSVTGALQAGVPAEPSQRAPV